METSWPHGQYLVELMEGSTKVKVEKDTIKALRVTRERLDKEIDRLTKKRAAILSSLGRICNHPLEQARITETNEEADDVYAITCGSCSAELRVYRRKLR
jgi:hypothetical protein